MLLVFISGNFLFQDSPYFLHFLALFQPFVKIVNIQESLYKFDKNTLDYIQIFKRFRFYHLHIQGIT